FGPRQDPSSSYSGVISVFVKRALAGEPLAIFGDGGQTRDFVYVENVVDANVLAAAATAASGRVYNVGCGGRTTLLELANAVGAAAQRPPRIELRDARAGDIRHSAADIARARAELGYEPTVGLAEGLARLLAHECAGE